MRMNKAGLEEETRLRVLVLVKKMRGDPGDENFVYP